MKKVIHTVSDAQAMPSEDYEGLLETIEILSNPKATAALRGARVGRSVYKELDLKDENFGF